MLVSGVVCGVCASLCQTQFEGVTGSLCQTQFFLVNPVVDRFLGELCLSLCETQFEGVTESLCQTQFEGESLCSSLFRCISMGFCFSLDYFY